MRAFRRPPIVLLAAPGLEVSWLVTLCSIAVKVDPVGDRFSSTEAGPGATLPPACCCKRRPS
jgi:hypothetical protein